MRSPFLLVVVILAGCSALSGGFSRVPVPNELTPASNLKLNTVVAAEGVQIYRCDTRKDQPGQYEWSFQWPEATLRDVAGRYLGKHYAGPTWEAEDGSKVVGTVDARRDAPSRGAIPWLRLTTRSTGPAGAFSSVAAIVRIGTTGGVAPATGCNEVELGRIVRVPYTSDYNLYVAR